MSNLDVLFSERNIFVLKIVQCKAITFSKLWSALWFYGRMKAKVAFDIKSTSLPCLCTIFKPLHKCTGPLRGTGSGSSRSTSRSKLKIRPRNQSAHQYHSMQGGATASPIPSHFMDGEPEETCPTQPYHWMQWAPYSVSHRMEGGKTSSASGTTKWKVGQRSV